MRSLSSIAKVALGLLALLFTLTIAMAEEGGAKARKPSKETLEKYDANKDGVLDETEQAAAKAGAVAKAKETREANLAKYDTNKDGKIDETEKAAKTADEEAAKAEKKAEKEAKKAAKEEKK